MNLLMTREASFHGRRLLAKCLAVHHSFGRSRSQSKWSGGRRPWKPGWHWMSGWHPHSLNYAGNSNVAESG